MLEPLKSLREAIGKTLTHAYYGDNSSLLLVFGQEAVQIGIGQSGGGFSRLYLQDEEFSPLSWRDVLVTNGHYSKDEMDAIWRSQMEAHMREREAKERVEYERLKAKFEKGEKERHSDAEK